MFISDQEHVVYTKNALTEVLCQLRYPAILSVDRDEPIDFQELLRAEYPYYSTRTGQPPAAQQQQAQPKSITAHQFLSADKRWRVHLTRNALTFSTRVYTQWSEFAARLDVVLAHFIKTYHPAFFEQISMRYVNAISRKRLDLEDTPWRELIAPEYLGPLAFSDLREEDAKSCSVELQAALTSSVNVRIHAGPGFLRVEAPTPTIEKEPRHILDLDFAMQGEQMPVNLCGGSIETLHAHAFPVFRAAITDTLHDAML